MRAGGAGCPAKLLAMGWLLLVGLQASHATNVTAIQEPGVAREGESESDVDEEAENDTDVPENEVPADAEEEVQNRTVVKEVEFGMCTVTCGVGIREVILTNGCPGGESKCIVRVEECRGPVDCGWGKPISETLENVRLSCVHISPVNRFKYMWKLLKSDQQPVILANDSAVLEVQRELHPMAFECDTLDSNEIVASIRFTVYTTSGVSCQSSFKNSLVLGCSGGTELMGDLVEWFTGYGSGSPTVVFSLWNASNPVVVQSMRLDASADLPTKLKFQLKLQMRRISRPDTDAVLVFVLTIGVIICIFVIFVLIFIIINWAAVKSFWGAKASTTEMHSELSSMRYKDSTSLEQSPADIPVHEDDALSEWNE